MVIVASQKSSDSTSVFLAHLIVLAVLIVVFALCSISYMETLWMKDEIKHEAKELRKLKEEIKEKIK
jgi:hypothetical protein